jgi:seryl-tRNA synthetase
MLDIKFIRENKDLVALGVKKKHVNFSVDDLIKKDDERSFGIVGQSDQGVCRLS